MIAIDRRSGGKSTWIQKNTLEFEFFFQWDTRNWTNRVNKISEKKSFKTFLSMFQRPRDYPWKRVKCNGSLRTEKIFIHCEVETRKQQIQCALAWSKRNLRFIELEWMLYLATELFIFSLKAKVHHFNKVNQMFENICMIFSTADKYWSSTTRWILYLWILNQTSPLPPKMSSTIFIEKLVRIWLSNPPNLKDEKIICLNPWKKWKTNTDDPILQPLYQHRI